MKQLSGKVKSSADLALEACRVLCDLLDTAANRAMSCDGPCGDELDEIKRDRVLRAKLTRAYTLAESARRSAQAREDGE